GDDHNTDLYFELLLPLLADAPGVKSFEAVLGYRLSDYASVGRADSWKAELLYQPTDAIRVRGSYQEAIRAASVYELYLPQLPAFFGYFDFVNGTEPCEVGSIERTGADAESVEALCIAQGVPGALMPVFQDSDFGADGVAGGNPGLGPEKASTSTVGVVWTRSLSHALVSNVQISLDWYRIAIADRISEVPFAQMIGHCYDARYNPDFSLTNDWCTYFARDAVSGEIQHVRGILRNAYDWKTDGLDLQLDWQFDLGPGQATITWLLAWVDSVTIDDNTAPPEELAGTIGSPIGGSFTLGVGVSFPEWKSNLNLSYAWRDLTLGATWRYIDAMTDANPSLSPVFRIPSMDYVDVYAAYEF